MGSKAGFQVPRCAGRRPVLGASKQAFRWGAFVLSKKSYRAFDNG
jgi:hypothetical protein